MSQVSFSIIIHVCVLVCSSTVDYNIMPPLELTFSPTSDMSQVLCVNISIVRDAVVEGAESFQVNLAGVGLPELVTVQPSSAVVNIIDENGGSKETEISVLIYKSIP